jgi:hypothetical protein
MMVQAMCKMQNNNCCKWSTLASLLVTVQSMLCHYSLRMCMTR